ncbi:hypothetical protein BDN72DRAFT_893247 [Pluteus cervinus]|uniref:Uncharacterized protein n=1 Tax=Pluteus cervinus TaxID=181527 RepID=A0ACD3B9F5_9AGAR|nr:hypothetical protein BDN72DRAFT_893247 [Pluteus cervinus]
MSAPTAHPGLEELPEYSPSISGLIPRTEHIVSISHKDQKWASLYMLSFAKSSSSLPMLLQGFEMPCRVELDLAKPTEIQKVTATVEASLQSAEWFGEAFAPIDDETEASGKMFYTKEHVLWDSSSGQTASSLQGHHSWSFNVGLPTQVSLPDKPSDLFPTPPAFTEPSIPVNIDYRIRIKIKQGWMGGKSFLLGRFGYLPLDVADPPSPLRTLVYQEGVGNLLGPDADPEGWLVLPSVTTTGTLFSVRTAEIKATLAIAKPLTYSRNTPIPLVLTLESDDTQALDVVSQPSMIHLHLARTVCYTHKPIDTAHHTNGPVTAAYFWPETPPGLDGVPSYGASGDSPTKRILRGEVLVHPILKPSFTFHRLIVQYQLDFFSFEGPGFVPTNPSSSVNESGSTPLISQPIKVVACHSPGVLARSFAPPGSPDLSTLVKVAEPDRIHILY